MSNGVQIIRGLPRRVDIARGIYAMAILHENGLSVTFDIFDGIDADGPTIGWHGFVKWDGCSNWIPGNGEESVYAHFCDEDAERDFGALLVRLRRVARDMMGDEAMFEVSE